MKIHLIRNLLHGHTGAFAPSPSPTPIFFVSLENVSILSLAMLNVVMYCSDHHRINLFLVFPLFVVLFLREDFLIYGHSKPEDYFGFVSMLITSCFSMFHLLFFYPDYQNVWSWFVFSTVLLTVVIPCHRSSQPTSPPTDTDHWPLPPSGDRIYPPHCPLPPWRDAFCLKSL